MKAEAFPVLLVLAALDCGSAAPSPGAAFLRARGTAIADSDGNPVFLEGVSFGNQVWANAALPNDHAEGRRAHGRDSQEGRSRREEDPDRGGRQGENLSEWTESC